MATLLDMTTRYPCSLWQDHPLVALDPMALMRVLLLRLAGALPIAAFIAIALSLLSQRGIQVPYPSPTPNNKTNNNPNPDPNLIQLMPSFMTLVNMALILLPFFCNGMAVSLMPDRKREYILRPRPHLPRTSRAPPAHLPHTSLAPPLAPRTAFSPPSAGTCSASRSSTPSSATPPWRCP